jgi:hypothetical protein
LARALLAADFIHNLVDKDVLKKVVDNYKERFKPPESARANKLCQDTLWSYCLDRHTKPEHVCKQFNWFGLVDGPGEQQIEENTSEEEGDSGQDSE